MFAPKNILVPTDFSEHADKALKEAVAIAEQYKSKIFLLHVYDEGLQQCAVDYCLPFEQVASLENAAIKTSKERLDEEVKAIASGGKVQIAYDIQKGLPVETILQEQKDLGIDLIVMGSHGRTGLLKSLIGSVAERVVRNAGCEVLVVR
ncbi:MAG: universal stress protein [Deltaproteobacteria bacterium HGW-Deltaproteobacteria-19]|jgi:nucleotide-binding universal stress UspA family protein|nr:MAG: universal stress protein [Deltaproteobacteria bacterium HGW-Deltaproteobacteria-19]